MNFLNELGHSLRESAFSYILSTTAAHALRAALRKKRLCWDQSRNIPKTNFCGSGKRKRTWSTVTAELPLASLRKYDP